MRAATDMVSERAPGVEPGHALASAAHGGRTLQVQALAREMIRRMREPDPMTPAEYDARGLIRRDMREREHADTFRDLRTQLVARLGGRNGVILVAPVSPGCGASYVATNLAAAFAFDESHTALLVDCNLRDPSLHARLGVDDAAGGLSDFLDRDGMSVETLIRPTGVPRLRLVPAGGAREASSEYLSSYRMRGLLEHLRDRYADRYVVLDAPAIRSSPDARILAQFADAAVVVARYGADTPARIRNAVMTLEPGRVAGVVFNDAT